MGWAEIRKQARRTTHATFALSAVYRSADGNTETPCNARLHSEKKVFGDLDREGFARMIEDQNLIVLDKREIGTPEKNATVDFGNDIIVEIVNILPDTDDFVRCEVTLP